jgi:hypothetical protein
MTHDSWGSNVEGPSSAKYRDPSDSTYQGVGESNKVVRLQQIHVGHLVGRAPNVRGIRVWHCTCRQWGPTGTNKSRPLRNVTTRLKDPDQLGWLVNISIYLTLTHKIALHTRFNWQKEWTWSIFVYMSDEQLLKCMHLYDLIMLFSKW